MQRRNQVAAIHGLPTAQPVAQGGGDGEDAQEGNMPYTVSVTQGNAGNAHFGDRCHSFACTEHSHVLCTYCANRN